MCRANPNDQSETLPDRRKNRGPHPRDRELFAPGCHQALRTAVAELSWLLSRDYAEPSALELVGNRHQLVGRQREAVRRAACSDDELERRRRRALPVEEAHELGVDGFNMLITVESALSGAVILVGRDGAYRDLASIHGSYRQVTQTDEAVRLLLTTAREAGVAQLAWYLDRPVSNSGRLRGRIEALLADDVMAGTVALDDNPDRVLVANHDVVASSDAWVLDHAGRWSALAAEAIARHVPGAWIVDLRVQG